jgi:gliding motility-associated-like protein
MRTGFLSILLALFILPVFAQLKLSMGDHFLAGQNIKKVEVSPEDYTVWALTQDNKVYYKTATSNSFNLYTPVSGMAVTDLAGYTMDEMYFLVGNIIVRVKSGVTTNLTIPDPLITKVNGIAIVASVYNTSQDIYALKDGWLMIATDDNPYLLPKGSTTFQPFNTPSFLTHIPYNWNYIRSTFKSVNMRSNEPMNQCIPGPNLTFFNIFDYTLFSNGDILFPSNQGQFTANLMPLHPYDLFSGGGYGYNHIYNIWSTTQGLYASYNLNCSIRPIVQPITEQVNAISEVMALTEIDPQQFILAGTNNGLQYTPNTIFNTQNQPYDLSVIKFLPFTNFPNVKVNDILVDSRKDPEPSPFVFVCDAAAYVATTDGVYQVYLAYDQQAYNNLRAQNFATYNGTTPTYNANGDAVFNRCDDAQPVNVGLLDHANTAIIIKWFKDGVEVPEWINKQTVTFTANGTYHAEVISMCEGVKINSVNFIVQSSADPQITFNYPDNVAICEGSVYPLTTLAVQGYSYRWFKDNQQIPSVTSNSYTATQPGQYRVEVSNCGTFYKPSKTVTISNIILTAPVIAPDKTSYCSSETAVLSVANTNQYDVKWYLNGNELTANANQNMVSATTAGGYTAKFLSNGCEKLSPVYNLSFNQPIAFSILKSKAGALCYGDQVTLSTNAVASSYLWSTGETTPQIIVSKPGHYTVQLTSPGSCVSIQATDVVILPQVQLAAIDNKTICTIAGDKLRILAQTGFVNYNWNGQSTTNNYLDVTAIGGYTLIVTTADGCVAKTTFEVTPWCENVIVTNTFTPNGDGINDFWEIGGVENDATATVHIYNRYGQILVNKKASGYKWDGKLNGKDMPAGTYYYEIKTKNSATPLTGWVAIIR